MTAVLTAPTLMALALAIPLIGTVLILMSEGRPNQRETVTMLTAIALFAAVVLLVPGVFHGARPVLSLFQILPGIEISFQMEPLGMMFACVASGLWIVNSIYSIGYMRAKKEGHQTRFYACFAIAIFGAVGVAMSGNMLTLFIFYEVLTLSTYPLVAHHGDEECEPVGARLSRYPADHVDPVSTRWRSSGLRLPPARSTSSRAASSPASCRARRSG